jgi:AcrR family transcriptional regulator
VTRVWPVTGVEPDGEQTKPRPARGRKRRPTSEVRSLILAAARDLFARRGYQATTTRDIATEAGVNEAMIYRHFGTKSNLFETAVGEPYRTFINEFTEQWKSIDTSEPVLVGRKAVEIFVEGLYDAMSANRDLILAYIFAQYFDLGETANAGEGSVISDSLRSIDDFTREKALALHMYDLDVPITLRCSFALVMGLALHGDLIFGRERDRPSRTRLLREVTTYIHHALATRRVELH